MVHCICIGIVKGHWRASASSAGQTFFWWTKRGTKGYSLWISARMNSPIGRNVAFCSTHYNQRISCIGDSKLSSYDCLELCNIRMEQQLVARAVILREVLLIRDGILAFSNDLFDLSDSNDLILLLSSWSIWSTVVLHRYVVVTFFIYFVVLYVRIS